METHWPASSDKRPFIAIVPWDSGFRAWNATDELTGETWHPQGARILVVEPTDPEILAEALTHQVVERQVSALLLIGRTGEPGAVRLQTRAENYRLGAKERLDHTGAGVVRATIPAADILRDLHKADFVARAASDAEDDVGSYLLYRVLANLPDGMPTPHVGLLRLPRDMGPAQVNQAIRVTVSAIARHLPTLATTSW